MESVEEYAEEVCEKWKHCPLCRSEDGFAKRVGVTGVTRLTCKACSAEWWIIVTWRGKIKGMMLMKIGLSQIAVQYRSQTKPLEEWMALDLGTENVKESEGTHTRGKEVEEYKEEELIDERNDVRKVVRICPVCNLEIDEEASFCPHCAYKEKLASKRNLGLIILGTGLLQMFCGFCLVLGNENPSLEMLLVIPGGFITTIIGGVVAFYYFAKEGEVELESLRQAEETNFNIFKEKIEGVLKNEPDGLTLKEIGEKTKEPWGVTIAMPDEWYRRLERDLGLVVEKKEGKIIWRVKKRK